MDIKKTQKLRKLCQPVADYLKKNCDVGVDVNITADRIAITKLDHDAKQQIIFPSTNSVEIEKLNVGDFFLIGDKKFRVMEKIAGCVGVLAWDNWENKDIKFDSNSTNYIGSEIETYIEENVKPYIEKELGEDAIVCVEIEDAPLIDETKKINIVKSIRPMTFEEFRCFGDLTVNENLDNYYWLMTPWGTDGRGYKYSVCVVSPSGYLGNYSYNDYYGVRPFLYLDSSIFVSKTEVEV